MKTPVAKITETIATSKKFIIQYLITKLLVIDSKFPKNYVNYIIMEILIYIIVIGFLIYFIFRPTTKKELKKYEDKDNWSNMGF